MLFVVRYRKPFTAKAIFHLIITADYYQSLLAMICNQPVIQFNAFGVKVCAWLVEQHNRRIGKNALPQLYSLLHAG
jgi:hypothetical protein